MNPSLNLRIQAFARLGSFLYTYHSFKSKNVIPTDFPLSSLEKFDEVVAKAAIYNPWFTPENQLYSFLALAKMLDKDALHAWTDHYKIDSSDSYSRTINVIMAGNIPMVGFHDFLCVLMAGFNFNGKLSSNDLFLLPALADILIDLEPAFGDRIVFTEGRIENKDAVIATGSNNSFRYFEYYFRDVPRILRKNRNGIAVITGNETDDELEGLTDDIFLYFGMGCRSVTKVFVPKDFDVRRIFKYFGKYEGLAQHNKYRNNYDYYKSIYLINKDDFYEAGLVLFKRTEGFAVSPVSVVFYEEYESIDHIQKLIQDHVNDIQCVVSKAALPCAVVSFGKSQQPGLSDYADGVDVMEFLLNL
ncbi:MAG: acyl-CoA reductase [Bacteroidota bacterium]